MSRVHAFTDDALGDLDAVGIADALRSRDRSVPDLVDAAIARAESVDPQLAAIIHRDYARARRRSLAPGGGFFTGVPTFIKDNIDVAGLPTQFGTDAFVGTMRPKDSPFARLLHSAGFLTLGKTQLSEFGLSASAEHPRLDAVRNPWDPARTAGASSAGSAALVAAGVVPVAHANDGGGSIRIPAAATGLVGLKPSRGRLPIDPAANRLPVSLITEGVVSRTVRDTAAFYREAERIWRNPLLPPIGDVTRPLERPLRIGVLTSSLDRTADAEVVDAVTATATLLADLGHQVNDVEPWMPATFPQDFLTYWGFLSLLITGGGRLAFGRTWDPAKLDNLTLGLAEQCRRDWSRLPGAIRRLRASQLDSRRLFRSYDVVLSPTVATATPRIGQLDPTQDYEQVLERLLAWVAFTPYQNATGDPAVSLPLARDEAGLPLGMMFTGPLGQEGRLLQLALQLEQARPWPRIAD